MIEHAIIISCDDDARLGSYFQECASFARAIFETEAHIRLEEINGCNCHRVHIDFNMPEERVMLTIFSHGTEMAFVRENLPFIDIETKYIDNKVVYTNACLAGLQFGNALSERGGIFIGYKIETKLPPSSSSYLRKFLECDTYPILYLFNQRISLRELESKMEEKFNNAIDEIVKDRGKNYFLLAAMLEKARDNFVVLGNDLDMSLAKQINN